MSDYRPLDLPMFPVQAAPDIRKEPPTRTLHDEIDAWCGHVLGFVPLSVFSYKLTCWLWLVF